ncbi:MAG: hypothetical protein PSX36_06945 [bacterium]|nr:hypothetical protein [bacterium]
MRNRLLAMFVFLLLGGVLPAQLKVVKPIVTHPKRTTLAFGLGATRSVVYLSRNIKANNDAKGLTISAVYGGARLLRVSVEYTYYRILDISPTWYDIRANTIEANLHFLARFKSRKAVFYPIVGLSYNVFSGYFTGVNDYLNLTSLYPVNETVTTHWLGLNAGTGYEYYFKPGSLFIDYKMRVGVTEGTNQLNIQDVCFSAGLRFNFRVPSIYKVFKGTRGRYSLDTVDSEW